MGISKMIFFFSFVMKKIDFFLIFIPGRKLPHKFYVEDALYCSAREAVLPSSGKRDNIFNSNKTMR
jgi:hypothetical protein